MTPWLKTHSTLTEAWVWLPEPKSGGSQSSVTFNSAPGDLIPLAPMSTHSHAHTHLTLHTQKKSFKTKMLLLKYVIFILTTVLRAIIRKLKLHEFN